MLIEQTLFGPDGRPLGKAFTDSQTGRTTFQPREPSPRLAGRTWRSVAACRRAVMAAGTQPALDALRESRE